MEWNEQLKREMPVYSGKKRPVSRRNRATIRGKKATFTFGKAMWAKPLSPSSFPGPCPRVYFVLETDHVASHESKKGMLVLRPDANR